MDSLKKYWPLFLVFGLVASPIVWMIVGAIIFRSGLLVQSQPEVRIFAAVAWMTGGLCVVSIALYVL
jgi:hypothetical protein